jgi:hypothetical protein
MREREAGGPRLTPRRRGSLRALAAQGRIRTPWGRERIPAPVLACLAAVLVLKAVLVVYPRADKLTEVCHQAVHVRALDGKPFTPAEVSAERAALKVSSAIPLRVPILGSLGVMIWTGAPLPRNGNFPGAESFRRQVRQLSTRSLLLDVLILLAAIAHFLHAAPAW